MRYKDHRLSLYTFKMVWRLCTTYIIYNLDFEKAHVCLSRLFDDLWHVCLAVPSKLVTSVNDNKYWDRVSKLDCNTYVWNELVIGCLQNEYLRRLYTFVSFSAILSKKDNFCDFPFAFLHIKSRLKEKQRSTLKGKHLLPLGANAFLFEQTLLQKISQTILAELSPLKVYQSPLIH